MASEKKDFSSHLRYAEARTSAASGVIRRLSQGEET